MEGVPLPNPNRSGNRSSPENGSPGRTGFDRSPLVMTLGIGTLVLVLVSLTLLFLVKRESAQQAFDAGLNEFKQKRFSVSIERFDEFLKTFPRHDLTKNGRRVFEPCKSRTSPGGFAPDWNRAVSLLEQYVRSIRELSNFSEMQVYARDAATRIALSAADGAGLQKETRVDRNLDQCRPHTRDELSRGSAPGGQAETDCRCSGEIRANHRRHEFIGDLWKRSGRVWNVVNRWRRCRSTGNWSMTTPIP